MTGNTKRTLLVGLILLPIFYFGMQLLLAPGYPGYSLVRDPTSELGSSQSPVALWFNALAILGGLLGMAGAWGAWRVLRDASAGMVKALLLPVIVAVVALGSIWAGIFPMPHPLHPMNPATPAMLAMPLVAALYAWWAQPLRPLRGFSLVNLIVFLVVLSIMFGLVPVDREGMDGLLQRLLALPVFLPIGLIGWQLRGGLSAAA